MLIRIKVRNFRSFRDEQEFTLEATALKGSPDPIIETPVTLHGVLRATAIYGANASGKTNLLRALVFMRNAVESSQTKWDPEAKIANQPFALDAAKQEPSLFEVDFVLDGVLYQYGFELDSERIIQEWLYAYPAKKRQIWFQRKDSFQFGRNLPGENQTIANLTRKNSLFLSAAAQNNHEALMPIYRWFLSIRYVGASRDQLRNTTARLCEDPDFRQRLLKLISAVDMGVIGLDAKEEELDAEAKEVAEKMKSLFPSLQFPPKTTRVALLHQASERSDGIPLLFREESHGTQTYFSLLGPVIQTILSGGILCIDELEASLHPLLAMEVVRFFNGRERNLRGAQLIFNTHDTNLLTKDLLRRDQVWFTEKDVAGCSHLYRLTDFKPRKNENLQSGYLEGRYGALPVIGAVDFLGD